MQSHPLPASRIDEIKEWIADHQDQLKGRELIDGGPLP